MIKHIIWDFDGTLFNTYPEVAKVFKKALQSFNINENSSSILKNLHISLWYTFTTYAEKYNLDFEKLRHKFTQLDELMPPFSSKPFKGVDKVLKSISGYNFIYTHRGNSTYKYLNHYNYLKYFKEVITREDGYLRKPEPQALIYLIEKYKLDKKQTIYIGDRDIDVQCANRAGILACYYNSHNIKTKEIANYIIDDYNKLKL